MSDIVNKSKVKEIIQGQGCNAGGDVFEALNQKIEELIKDGCKRCTGRGFKTLKGVDI